jgi:hypothetical protein
LSLFDAAPVRRVVAAALAVDGFRMFASKGQNGFVGCANCFVAVSRQNILSGFLPWQARF